jgi:hypothetical protein
MVVFSTPATRKSKKRWCKGSFAEGTEEEFYIGFFFKNMENVEIYPCEMCRAPWIFIESDFQEFGFGIH